MVRYRLIYLFLLSSCFCPVKGYKNIGKFTIFICTSVQYVSNIAPKNKLISSLLHASVSVLLGTLHIDNVHEVLLAFRIQEI